MNFLSRIFATAGEAIQGALKRGPVSITVQTAPGGDEVSDVAKKLRPITVAAPLAGVDVEVRTAPAAGTTGPAITVRIARRASAEAA